MKQFFAVAGIILAFMAALFIIGNIATAGSFASYAFWAPKQQALARQVYQQTPSYVNGNLADLRDLRDQINLQKDPETKATLQAGLRDKLNHLPADFEVPADISAAANN